MRLYSEYVLEDKNTGRVYSSKLRLNELCLPNIENATDEERSSGLYDWASFFSAKTWEELKMAAKNEAMKSAVVTMKKLTADEKVRLQCEARERYMLDQRTYQAILRDKEEKLKEAESKNHALYDLMRQNPSMTAAEILEKMGNQEI